MCNCGAVAPRAAPAAACQPHRSVQHTSVVRTTRKAQLMARCAAATAPPAAAASTGASAPLHLHPLLLERGCAASSLSRDKLSQQEQEMLIGMGAAIRALQQVRGRREPAGSQPWHAVRHTLLSMHVSRHANYRTNHAPRLQPPQDLPAMLERQPEHLDSCSEAVVFEDRLSPRLGLPAASCQGKEAYSRLCWSLRFHRTLFFSKAKVGGAGAGAGAAG